MTWRIILSHYQTYAEIAEQGDRPRELVASGLTFAQAQARVEALGFGYSMHPEGML